MFDFSKYPNHTYIVNENQAVVYRIDTRAPSEIMLDGFNSKGTNDDLSAFILGPQDDAGFISTSLSTPKEMLAHYQLRGFLLDCVLNNGYVSNSISILPDTGEPADEMERPWSYHRYEGESTGYVYQIVLEPNQGVNVELSTFPNSNLHDGQREISVFSKITQNQIKGVYEVTVDFPLDSKKKLTELSRRLNEKPPHEVLSLEQLTRRNRSTREPLWESYDEFIFNDEKTSRILHTSLVEDANSYAFNLSARSSESAEPEITFRTIKIKETNSNMIIDRAFAGSLLEAIHNTLIGKIQSTSEFSPSKPVMYTLHRLDKNSISNGKFKKAPKKLGALDDSINFSDWEIPDQEYLLSLDEHITNSSNYEKTLIIQLQGDETSFDACEALFSKHPKQSEWLQLGKTTEVLTWNEANQHFAYTSALKLEKEGKIRITLVGHGKTEGEITTLGGMDAETLKGHLSKLFARLPDPGLIQDITLNLTGCSLLDPNKVLADTLPGQLALWLKEQTDNFGLEPGSWVVNARENDLLVRQNGKKEVLIDGQWISKEVAEINHLVHKTTLAWDADQQALIKLPLSAEELKQVTPAIDSAIALHAALDRPSATLLEQLHSQVCERIGELLALSKEPSHRTEIERRVSELLDLVDLGHAWNDAATLLHQQHLLDENWHATFTVTPGEQGEHQVTFVHALTHETQKFSTSEAIFAEFSQQYETLLGHFSGGLLMDKNTGALLPKPEVTEAEAAHTLNAAFMFQTLMSINPKNGGMNALTWPLQVQTYTQLAQNAMGLFQDAATLIKLVKLASATELKPLTVASSLLGSVSIGLAGLLLDVANIVGMSFQLHQSTDPTETNTTIANLTMTSVMVGTGIASMVASLTAATAAVSGVLGIVAVPLAGIAAGLPALVGNYTTLAEKRKATFKLFNAIQDSVKDPNILRLLSEAGQSPTIWGLAAGAVVDQVNFRDQHIRFGAVTSVGSKGGSWHTHAVNWDSYLSGPSVDYTLKLDLYRGLGLKEPRQAVELSKAEIFVLPTAAQRHYTFGYDEAPGVRYQNPSALMALSAYYDARFKWGFYALPTDWAVTNLAWVFARTPIQVQLDDKGRTLVIPTLLDDKTLKGGQQERSQLFYEFIGAGGQYTIVLPANPLGGVTLAASQEQQEHWTLDVESLIKHSTTVDNNMVLGALWPERINAMSLRGNTLTIGEQRIEFIGQTPASLLLESRLNLSAVSEQQQGVPSLTLAFSVEGQSGKITPTLFLSDETQVQAYAAQILQVTQPLKSLAQKIMFVSGQRTGVVDLANTRLWFTQPQGQLLLCDGDQLSVCRFPKEAQVLIGLDGNVMAQATTSNDFTVTARLDYQRGKIGISLVYLESSIADTVAFSQSPFQEFPDLTLIGALDAMVKRHPDSFAREHLSFDPKAIWTFTNPQKEGFTFASTDGTCLSITEAQWSDQQVSFSYNNLYSNTEKHLQIRVKPSIVELTLSHGQVALEWLDKHAQVIVTYEDTLNSLGLALNDLATENWYLAGSARQKPFTLKLLDQTRTSMLLTLTDKDLVMRSNQGHYVKLANALNMDKTLRVSFLNSEPMALEQIKQSILFALQEPATQVQRYFNLEPTIKVTLVQGRYQFVGACGLRYRAPQEIAAANQAAERDDEQASAAAMAEALALSQLMSHFSPFPMRPSPKPTLANVRAFTAEGYQGPHGYTIPAGIRSLSILLDIINGATIFNGLKFKNVNLDSLFPETGQEAINWLLQIEQLATQNYENKFMQRLMYGTHLGTPTGINVGAAREFIVDHLNAAIAQGGWRQLRTSSGEWA